MLLSNGGAGACLNFPFPPSNSAPILGMARNFSCPMTSIEADPEESAHRGVVAGLTRHYQLNTPTKLPLAWNIVSNY